MNSSRMLIIGANGQLGRALRIAYPDALSADATELDITNDASLNSYDWSKVSVIMNAAAYTNVDEAESPEGRVTSWKVNAHAVANLVSVALAHDLTLVHISTEYVFDGTKQLHLETEDLSPLGVYGQSKAAGDIAAMTLPKHYIIRTSWVIGDGKNFARTMLELAHKGLSPTVIADDIGRPTFTSELVRAIDHLLTTTAAYGTYNVSGGGPEVSWAGLTRAIFQVAGIDRVVTDTTDSAYYADKPQAARRPRNSVFDLSKLQASGFTPHDWQVDLKAYIAKEQRA
jgi:dTDP-4-dehydrorhamnose reductase